MMARFSRGIALVTVLLVVAIATLAATALLSASSIAIHRTAALRDSEQGWWVARGVEAWVLGILEKDAKDHDYDGLDEAWAQPVDHLPVDEGYLRGYIVDLQGRFNLNDLSPDTPTRDYEKQFDQLLAAALPKSQPPQGLVAAIQDWIDLDELPSPGGAEDSAYAALDPPYRAANRPFTVVSELLAVQGMTPEIYGGLKDLVCALPETRKPINVNTAPVPVLIALGADPMKITQWDSKRKDEPVTDPPGLNKFIQDYMGPGTKQTDLTFKSEYFQIQGEVFVGSSRVALYSLIHRPSAGAPTVLAHSADAE